MDSQVGESSSRETQLEKEILQLKKENENLRALNISLQQGIFSYICISVDISQPQPHGSSEKNLPEKVNKNIFVCLYRLYSCSVVVVEAC